MKAVLPKQELAQDTNVKVNTKSSSVSAYDDNRAESKTQAGLQAMATNSPQVKQLQSLQTIANAKVTQQNRPFQHHHSGWQAPLNLSRVEPMVQLKTQAINDDASLEAEADVMGAKAQNAAVLQPKLNSDGLKYAPLKPSNSLNRPIQRRLVRKEIGEPFDEDDIISDETLADELVGYDDAFKAVVMGYQNSGNPYSFSAVMALALRSRIDHLPADAAPPPLASAAKMQKSPASGSKMEKPSPSVKASSKEEPAKKLPAITRLDSAFISPQSPVYEPFPSSVKAKSDTWEDNRDNFVTAFNKRIQGAMKAGHPASIKGADNNLSRIAWIIETLNQARTCVAVIVSSTHLHVFANHHDQNLAEQLNTLIVASQDLTFASKEYKDLLFLLTENVLVNRGSRPKKQETIDRKTAMVKRRLQKAMQVINQLKIGIKNIAVHQVSPKHKGRKKHGEMRAADSVVDARKGVKTPISFDAGISKICCAKCEIALQSLNSVYGISFKVQEAHWQVYDTDTGWPIPEFLKTNPAAMQQFLGDAAYAIYVKFPEEASRVIEGMKKKVKPKEKLDNPSSKDTGYLSSGDEYDEDRDFGVSASASKVSDDSSEEEGSDLEDEEDYELDTHQVIEGYDDDDSPQITISDHVIQLYLDDLENDNAYLSVAEGQAAAIALEVQANVFNQLRASTNGYYFDAHTNQFYRGTIPQTYADGNCLLHGLNLIRQNRNMTAAQIKICRLYLGNVLNHDNLRIQIEDMVRARLQGEHIPGLGSNMARLLGFNREIQKAMKKEAAKASSVAIPKLVASASLQLSSSVKVPVSVPASSAKLSVAPPPKKIAAAQLPATTGLISFNTTYGNSATRGILLFTGDHYIRLVACANPFQ